VGVPEILLLALAAAVNAGVGDILMDAILCGNANAPDAILEFKRTSNDHVW
jgi:hypothetical protein